MGKGGTQCARVRALGQIAGCVHAQAFFFDAAHHLFEQGSGGGLIEQPQAPFKFMHGDRCQRRMRVVPRWRRVGACGRREPVPCCCRWQAPALCARIGVMVRVWNGWLSV